MAAALFLGQDVDVCLELGVRGDRVGLAHDLPTLNVLALGASQQQADVFSRTALIKELAEHLDAGDDRLRRRAGVNADNLDLGVDLEHTTVDATGDDRATTGDREDVLHGHHERLIQVALGLRNVLIDLIHELSHGRGPLLVTLERLQRRDAHDGQIVTGELVGGQQLADLHLDKLHDLFVVHHVGLVQCDHDVGNADLTSEQHVLLGLRHRTICGRHDKNRTVHLCRTRDHVLHVVSVPGAVDVSVVTLLRLVLDMRNGDRDAALLLFRGLVDLIECLGVRVLSRILVVQNLRDRSGQRRLTVVNVTDGADVDVRLGPLELSLRHWGSSCWT